MHGGLCFARPSLVMHDSRDPNHLITTGGEGHFFWNKTVGYWLDGQFVSDYNYDGDGGSLNYLFLFLSID